MKSAKHVNMNKINCVKFRSGLPANEVENRNGVSVEFDEPNVPYTIFQHLLQYFEVFFF